METTIVSLPVATASTENFGGWDESSQTKKEEGKGSFQCLPPVAPHQNASVISTSAGSVPAQTIPTKISSLQSNSHLINIRDKPESLQSVDGFRYVLSPNQRNQVLFSHSTAQASVSGLFGKELCSVSVAVEKIPSMMEKKERLRKYYSSSTTGATFNSALPREVATRSCHVLQRLWNHRTVLQPPRYFCHSASPLHRGLP